MYEEHLSLKHYPKDTPEEAGSETLYFKLSSDNLLLSASGFFFTFKLYQNDKSRCIEPKTGSRLLTQTE